MPSALMPATELEKYIGELEKENKKLRECNKSQSEVINNVFIPQQERLEEENKKLNEKYNWLWKIYTEDVNERVEENKKLQEKVNTYSEEYGELREENKKLKSDLEECECSMHYENDEVWYRKRECKKLKEKIQTLELWLDNKEKLNEEYRKQLDGYKM